MALGQSTFTKSILMPGASRDYKTCAPGIPRLCLDMVPACVADAMLGEGLNHGLAWARVGTLFVRIDDR
jgi:hypothetical protein